MTRMEALEAVAAAARPYAYHGADNNRLLKALDALDALPAEPQPQREAVTLAVWEYEDGETYFCKPGSEMDDRGSRWTRLGTGTLLLDRERGE